MRRVLALGVTVLVAGCGVPHELPKQAEEVHSIAAEGGLLAHDASEGSTTGTFTREHAKALRKLLRPLRAAIENRRLAEVADDVDRTLAELSKTPDDEERAAGAERRFEQLADAAEELAG